MLQQLSVEARSKKTHSPDSERYRPNVARRITL